MKVIKIFIVGVCDNSDQQNKKPANKEKIFSILHEVREEKRREYKYLDTPNGEVSKVLYADIQKRNLCCHLEIVKL